MLIAKEQKQSITRGVTLEPSVQAPVSQGQRLGTLTVRAGDEVLAEVPLVAETAVTRLTWKDLFLDFLGRAAMAADAS